MGAAEMGDLLQNLERRSIGVGSYRLRRFRVWQRSLGDVVMGG
jgi:hypothetical protein